MVLDGNLVVDPNRSGESVPAWRKFDKIVVSTTPVSREELAKRYDHVEEYDAAKQYVVGWFDADYTGVSRRYKFVLYSGSSVDSYVVAERYLSDEFLKPLEPYCRCPVCVRSVFNPMRWFYCRCCVGCILAGPDFVSPLRVDQALALRDKEERDRALELRRGFSLRDIVCVV